MPIPTGRDAHVDVPLSNYATRAFNTAAEQFIADRLFPMINVGKQSDKYYVIERGAFQRIPNTERARGTRARRVQFTVTSGSYYAPNHALATETPLEDLDNADVAIQIRENNTDLLLTNLRADQERRVANNVGSISNVGSGFQPTGSNKWSDGNSDPIAQVNTGAAFMKSRTGLVPNTMVLDWDTFKVVRRHPLLLDLYKYTAGGQVTRQQLAEAFDVQNILVPISVVENADEGGTSSMTSIWGNIAILAHVGPATGLRSMTFGVRMRWRSAAYPNDFGVMTSVENRAGSEHVEVQEVGYYQDERIVAPELAYTIDGTL